MAEHPVSWLDDPPGVDREVAADDFMFNNTAAEAYFRGGSSALRAIRLALAASGATNPPRRILDLPSGYGRVLRYLRAAWPNAEIVACELLAGGANYCAQRFGAVPVVSTPDPADLRLPGRFDVVWVGSLLTHLPSSAWIGWIKQFENATEPGALLLFSVHGRYVEQIMRDGGTYQLRPADVATVLANVESHGFGYADYPNQAAYGVSLSRADWVVREVLARGTWQLESYAERALNNHQDIVTLKRL